MKKTVVLLAFLSVAVFAQCLTEEQFTQKAIEMQEQCSKIIAIVPCAVGLRDDYPFQDKVMSLADDAALVELAKGVEAFVKYHSKDSIYMGGEIAQRLEENVSKVNVKQRLANTRSIDRACASFAKNGKTLHRGASLRVLDPELYKEALAEVNKIEKEEEAVAASSPSVATPAPQVNAVKQNTSTEISLPVKFARAAKKYVPLAGKFIARLIGFPIP